MSKAENLPLKNYAHALSLFNRAKDKVKGKPIHHGSWNLRMQGEVILIEHCGYRVATLTPDNVLTMDVGYSPYRNNAFANVLPIGIWMGGGIPVCGSGYRPHIPYFPGIKWHMEEHKFLNARERPQHVIDPDRRKWWLGQRKIIRAQIIAHVRMGTLDTSMKYQTFTRKDAIEMVESGILTEAFLCHIYHAIKDQYSSWNEPPTTKQKINIGLYYFESFSVELRKHFGVITGSTWDQYKQE